MSIIEFKTYEEILELLDSNNSHLLLGNGFNNSLGVKTDYKSIFEKMHKEYKGYSDLNGSIVSENYDLEKIIGLLKGQINTESINKSFLDKYINAKIKLDFMSATQEIVREKVKQIYQEKNEEIHLLFRSFKNYFTLNYDSFLYLLLMKFKKTNSGAGISIAIQNTIKFQEDDINSEDTIYKKVKEAYENGIVSTNINGVKQTRNLRILPKKRFEDEVRDHYKEKFSAKSINRAFKLFWKKKEKEDQEKKVLNVNDGFLFEMDEFVYKNQNLQNLFFLHGAFHIYQKNGNNYKITQDSDKALYEKLEEILESDNEEVVCVFTDDNKDTEIKKNEYLNNAYKRLVTLKGAMVIIGVSLSDNDKHIFSNINKSEVDTIYISSKKSNKKEDYNKATKIFKDKKVILFDQETISYG